MYVKQRERRLLAAVLCQRVNVDSVRRPPQFAPVFLSFFLFGLYCGLH